MSQRTRTRDLIYESLPPIPIPGNGCCGDFNSGTIGKLIFNNIKDFPSVGKYNVLYFNRDNNTLYCWDGEENGYVPISADIMEGISVDGGGAADG